ncbi:MAG: Fe-S cluster assembly protein HesB [Actinobacteria bacterium]|nr:MAG: Fe-S cluster assembly protein HesB [Actinomycetota bacterium]
MATATPPTQIRKLFITGIPKADALLNSNGTALLIGMLLDQQVPMEWAFTGPYTIKQRLGHCDASKIAAMEEDKFVSVCCEKPAIHRFPASMAKRIHQMCVIIADEYKGKGSNIWSKIDDAETLRKRLRFLPGYGEEKTEIFIALLGKTFGVRPTGWKKTAGVFSDTKPRSVADIYSSASLLKVRGFKQMQRAQDVDKQDRPLR